MPIEFVEATGKVRPIEDYEAALRYYQKKLINVDFKDVEGVLHAPVVVELLKVVVEHLKATVAEMKSK